MTGDRRLRILARLVRDVTSDVPGEVATTQLCLASTEVTGMSGAGVMLMADDIPLGSVCTTDEVSHLVERLQHDLGEGPCIDAYRQDKPVLEPDLAGPAFRRWIAFTPPAVDAGVRAIFGYPLQVGDARLGALNFYRDRPGAPTDDQHADALVLAGIVANSVLLMQAEAPPGALAAELETGFDLHYVVHQAAGMVSAQLDTTVAQALIRLRARAFADGRHVADVARDVVSRSLRFFPDADEVDPSS